MSEHVVNLGEAPSESAGRDAVHVAVAPCVAGHRLHPGTRVGRYEDGTFGHHGKVLGVVDPFRTEDVELGGRFWLFLLPNTITSLRHVWTHPAFLVKPPIKERESD